MIYLVIFYVELCRVWDSVRQLYVLHGLEIHLEPFQVNQQQLWPLLYHHLTGGNLFGVAALTIEFVTQVEQFLRAKLL